MLTPKEKALEILRLPKNSNPNLGEVLAVQRELKQELPKETNKKLESTKDEEVQRLILEEEKREVNRIESAGVILQHQPSREVIILSDGALDEVNSQENLLKLLITAISCKDVDFLEKLLSKFKSGEGEEFGNYINTKLSYDSSPLYQACRGGCPDIVKLLLKHKANPKLLSTEQIKLLLCSRKTKEEFINEIYDDFFYSTTDSKNTKKEDEIEFKEQLRVILGDIYSDSGTKKDYIKIKELLLQYGADPKEVEKTFNYGATDLIKGPFLPWGGNNEIKRTVIRYGAVDSNYTLFNIASAVTCSLLTVRFAMLGASSSPWFFIGAAAFIIPASMSIYNVLISCAGYILPTEPSPKFTEAKAESGKATVLEQA